MSFTVTRSAGDKVDDFETYARLLLQQGKDLRNVPRVPDPEDLKRRWAYVWDSQAEAERFVEELRDQTGDSTWRVEQTFTPPSYGPFGPVLIQLARRSDGLFIAVHPLSLGMIREAFPSAMQSASNIIVDPQTWEAFLQRDGNLEQLIEQVVPVMSGLSIEELTEVGYAVIDADTDGTLVYVPPTATTQIPA